jgi:hypothetical protein
VRWREQQPSRLAEAARQKQPVVDRTNVRRKSFGIAISWDAAINHQAPWSASETAHVPFGHEAVALCPKTSEHNAFRIE